MTAILLARGRDRRQLLRRAGVTLTPRQCEDQEHWVHLVQTIGYLEAWGRWFAGQEVDPQAEFGFMSVLWWGRVGKIATFIGGLTVILDILGPWCLRELSKRLRRRLPSYGSSLLPSPLPREGAQEAYTCIC
jgi:hypothetical protein